MANIKSIKAVSSIFVLTLIISDILAFQNIWPWKSRSRSWSITFAMVTYQLMSSIKIYNVIFFISAKIQPVNKKVTHTRGRTRAHTRAHAHAHTTHTQNEQAPRYRQNLAGLPKNEKCIRNLQQFKKCNQFN